MAVYTVTLNGRRIGSKSQYGQSFKDVFDAPSLSKARQLVYAKYEWVVGLTITCATTGQREESTGWGDAPVLARIVH